MPAPHPSSKYYNATHAKSAKSDDAMNACALRARAYRLGIIHLLETTTNTRARRKAGASRNPSTTSCAASSSNWTSLLFNGYEESRCDVVLCRRNNTMHTNTKKKKPANCSSKVAREQRIRVRSHYFYGNTICYRHHTVTPPPTVAHQNSPATSYHYNARA